MLQFVTIIHVLLCVFMIFVILLQPGKDAGMGAAFGGGAATSAFGGRGAVTFLSKLTAGCAIMFFITSLGLSFVGLRQSVAAIEPVIPASAPAAPAVAVDAGVEVPAGLEKSTEQQVPPPGPAADRPATPAETESAKPPAAAPARPKGKAKK